MPKIEESVSKVLCSNSTTLFIITDKVNTIKDVAVINKVNTGSDQRMVNWQVKLNLKTRDRQNDSEEKLLIRPKRTLQNSYRKKYQVQDFIE